MSGGQRRLAVILAAGFLLILATVTIGNAESMISDFAAAGLHETRVHIWTWELTSVAGWLAVAPLLWWSAARFRPPRTDWRIALAIALAGLPLASVLHVAAMIGLRHVAYAAMGEHYTFAGSLADPYFYEFRKDAATYLQFLGTAAVAQWLLERARTPSAEDIAPSLPHAPAMFTVIDGSKRFLVPVDTIEHVSAAGNYVELHADGRTLTHRATLSGVEKELGKTFVRIHRSRLVQRAAIRSIETDRSGDFLVKLDSGLSLSGSRRYRDLVVGQPVSSQ
ncbi:LytTR family DNA-binding domain-containing protein [Sphingomonas sp. CJ20]